jgi:RNA polymerase subunit RPABC4/transcription elongation factor Spt4
MNQCTNCGAVLEPGATACPSCGTPVLAVESSAAATEAAPASSEVAGGTSTSTLMNLARGAKGLALACFLLPWVTVSCAGTPLARMTGLQMATGSISPVANPAAGMPGGPQTPSLENFTRGAEGDIFVIIAAALIVIGLVLLFVLPRRTAAVAGMATAAGAILVAGYDVLVRIKGALTDAIREGSASSGASGGSERQMEQQLAQMISIDASIGFWLTILALIASIVLLKMVHGRAT